QRACEQRSKSQEKKLAAREEHVVLQSRAGGALTTFIACGPDLESSYHARLGERRAWGTDTFGRRYGPCAPPQGSNTSPFRKARAVLRPDGEVVGHIHYESTARLGVKVNHVLARWER